MVITRRNSREWAVHMLVAAEMNPPEDVETFISGYWDFVRTLEKDDGGSDGHAVRGGMRRRTDEMVKGVLAEKDALDAIIGEYLQNWSLDRLGTVERTVLRLGVWELRVGATPKPVVINEAVDLVNWFSSPKSRTLVNGVLNAYAKSL